jgi:hypothetical protein
MLWSNLSYNGDLQEYINKTQSSLLDITIPKELVLYLILGKLLNQGLKQIIDFIALSPDCTKDPYLVLNALQTFHTHKLNKSEAKNNAVALLTSQKKFPTKLVQLCGFGKHNPKATKTLRQNVSRSIPI